MSWGYILGAIVGILIMLPPKYDPAIRWKEYLMKKNGDDKW